MPRRAAGRWVLQDARQRKDITPSRCNCNTLTAPHSVMSVAVAAVQRGLNAVLNDGLGDLLQYVDGKIGWFPPRAWVWLPGVYEWSVDAGEGDGHRDLGEAVAVVRRAAPPPRTKERD